MKKQKLFVFIFNNLLPFVFLLSCSNYSTDNLESNKKLFVNSEKMQTTNFIKEFNTFGSISYINKADITSNVDGIIEDIKFVEGDYVKKGTIICKLKNPQIEISQKRARASLLSAKAELEKCKVVYDETRRQFETRFIQNKQSQLSLAQQEKELNEQNKDLEKQKVLYEIGGITEDVYKKQCISFDAASSKLETQKLQHDIDSIGLRDIDIINAGYSVPNNENDRKIILTDINTRTALSNINFAEANVKSSELELSSIDYMIDNLFVKTTIDGIIGAKYFETGEKVSTNDKLFSIFEDSKKDVVFQVPEENSIHLYVGQKVTVNIDTLSQKDYIATIRIISPIIDSQNGNVIIKAQMPENKELVPGMFSRIKYSVGDSKKLSYLPLSCLQNFHSDKANIYIIEKNCAFKKEITIISNDNQYAYFLNDSTQFEVINNPPQYLEEGQEIEIIN